MMMATYFNHGARHKSFDLHESFFSFYFEHFQLGWFYHSFMLGFGATDHAGSQTGFIKP